jgi:hypothetical protein
MGEGETLNLIGNRTPGEEPQDLSCEMRAGAATGEVRLTRRRESATDRKGSGRRLGDAG